MRGPPPGFAALLRRKYAILQQEQDANTLRANAAVTSANAAAKLDTERAKIVAPESAANIGETKARTKYLGIQGTDIEATRPYRLRGLAADTRLTNARALGEEQVTDLFDNPYSTLDRNLLPRPGGLLSRR